MKKICLWFLVSLFVGCEPPQMGNQTTCVIFGQTHLSIPNHYFLSGFPPTLIPSPGLDQDVGELLEIPLNDLGYANKTGIGYDRVLSFLVTPLKVHHLQNGSSFSALKAWKGISPYKNRIIEFDNVTQWYRIYATKYRKSWEFFKSYPNDSMNYDETWVAGCLAGSQGQETPKLSEVTCKTLFIYKDIHIQMTFSGKYIDLIEEIKFKIRNLFKDWETESCKLN